MTSKTSTDPVALQQFIEDRIERLPWSGCWIWMKALQGRGYGSLVVNGKAWLAHRLSYFAFTGDPTALHVLHSCDVPSCVNPTHLFLGTDTDNAQDALRKSRRGKLPHYDRSNILDRLSTGESQSSIARAIGVSPTTIYRFARGLSYDRC